MKTLDITVTINYDEAIEGDVAWSIDKISDVFDNIGYDWEQLNVSVENPLY